MYFLTVLESGNPRVVVSKIDFLKSPFLSCRSLHSHVSSRGVCCVYISILISYFFKGTSAIELGPTQMTSFNLNYLFIDAISKYSQILRSWGLGPQQANFRECLIEFMGFPGGANDKEPTYQCRRHKRLRFDPWIRKLPWRRAWQPTLVFLPGQSHGQRSLTGYSP